MAVNRFVLNNISYHGAGAIGEIPGEIARRGFAKAFVCSDPDLVRFGVTGKVTAKLDEAGIPWELYDQIKPDPTIKNVQDGVAAFKASGADMIVAVGGGSAMDTAKGIGIIAENPEFADVVSLEGVAPTKNHATFTIAVPTTAGTAAEVTINYVITDPEKVRKFVCVDVNDIPDVAVVDPDMMASMPAGLTAATGMDALTHAIEGYTTKGAWELSDMFHLKAIELISKNLRAAYAEAKSGQPGAGREGHGAWPVRCGHGLLQRRPGHRPRHGAHVVGALRHAARRGVRHAAAGGYGVQQAGVRRAPGRRGACHGRRRCGHERRRGRRCGDRGRAPAVRRRGDPAVPATAWWRKTSSSWATDAMADACFPGKPREADHAQVVDLFRKVMA